ncbi:MAG: hypothetical protein ACRBI6_13050 [Acidimicrobiales bacterium]
MGWMLVALVGLTQLCVAWYWRAAISDAAARAAAAQSHLEAPSDICVATFAEALGPGADGAAVVVDEVRCELVGDLVVARTGFAMDPWLPLWPTLEVELEAVAVAERIPGEEP